ncbi:MAG: serine/threonine protein kinase [Burkholderiales bacterium]|nr:serine/threonine protein kinase [Burkholderiales bacterium]
MNPAQAIDDRADPAGARSPQSRALPPGTRLREYELAEVIGEAGFAIVYRAWDATLQRKVAVKEYLPVSMATRVAGTPNVTVASERQWDTYKAGLKSFVGEARLLARFDHASLVKVYRFWEGNGTAYMVMPFYEGPTLEAALADLDHVPGEAELRAWLKPVLNAVALLHEGGVWHQNIGPDNIVLTPIGPVLFGLGAAEQAIAAIEHTPAAALKPGFAAIEQYGNAAETKRGAWTDLYALAAVIYTAITGSAPAAAADRLAEDPVRPLGAVAAGLYGERFLAAIDAALAVEPERRPQDHQQFRALMGDIDSPAPLELAPPRDLMHEPFVGRDGDRQITVPDHPLLTIADPAVKAVLAKPAAAAAASPGKAAGERRARARAGGESTPSQPAELAPSWLSTSPVKKLFGKRALYGLVAGTGALIGVAALALQFYARQAPRPATAAPGVVASVPVANPTVAAPAVPAVAAATAVPPTATATPPPATTAAVSPPVAPAPAPAASAAPARAPTGADYLGTPVTATERQARCTEILQKASLESITPAETDFFKRECK